MLSFQTFPKMEPITFTARRHLFPNEASVDFGLQLVGSLPVHALTTMPMLPWVVAEVRRLSGQSSKKEPGTKQVRLCVSPSGLRCEPEPGRSQQWDPLICSSIFECKPQHVHKLIHNSHDPSYFACLIKDNAGSQQSICYVFKADDQTKVSGSGGENDEEVARWVFIVWGSGHLLYIDWDKHDNAVVVHRLFHRVFRLWGSFLCGFKEHLITDIRNYKFTSSKIQGRLGGAVG